MKFIREFTAFLKEHKVWALAIAVIMGAATTDLIQSMVKNILMPLLTPLLPGPDWQTAVWNIGPFSFGAGPFLSSLLNFVLIALVVFWLTKVAKNAEALPKKLPGLKLK